MTIHLQDFVRDVPDFPKPGIIFKDITPLLASPLAFGQAIGLLAHEYKDKHISKVLAIESRGFLFGAPLAHHLGCGLLPIRKPGKLPRKTLRESYKLEYGEDSLEIHAEDLAPQERVLVVDDVLATGGTAAAVSRMLEKMNADVVGFAFFIELTFLHGRKNLSPPVFSVLSY